MTNHYNFTHKTKKQRRKAQRGLLWLAGFVLSSTVGALMLSSYGQVDDKLDKIVRPLPIAAKANTGQQTLVRETNTKPALVAPLQLPPTEPPKKARQPEKIAIFELKEKTQTLPSASSTLVKAKSLVKQAAKPPADPWQQHQIQKGESLGRIFNEKSFPPDTLSRIIRSSEEADKQLSLIRPGQTLRLRQGENGELEELILLKSPTESVRLLANADKGFAIEITNKKVDKRTATASGVIQSSLFADGRKAGLSENKIMEMARLFRWDIDFALDIRPGDHFRVLYEADYLNGEKLRDGPILAAEFVSRGKAYQAFRYQDKEGIDYYDAKGHNKRRAFIRTPIKFAQVSSRFSKRRWHPVLKRWRSHKGVDYAAPTGTPIRATGDGRVVFRGWKNGYGRAVIIQHGGKYQTLYAHMSKFSSRTKKGQKVKQGQTIGYVGQSGLATGPHLHYEFRIHGVHRNPLTIKLPRSIRLHKRKLANFKKQTRPLLAKLDAIKPATLVAQNNIR